MKTEDLKAMAIAIEKIAATYVGNEISEMRARGGDKLANELLASVAALFMARATGILHVWTNEPLESIKKRVLETYEHDLKSTIRMLTANAAKVPK